MSAPTLLNNWGAFDLDEVLRMEPDSLNAEGEHQHESAASTSRRSSWPSPSAPGRT